MVCLTAVGKIFNGVKYKFPLEECISSVLEGADNFILVACTDSEDNTVEYCKELENKFNGRLKLLYDKWRITPIENYCNMVRLANRAIEAADAEWVWSVDVDEAMPIGEAAKLRPILKGLSIETGCVLLNFNHLYYDLEHKILGKLYDKMHRIARKAYGWRSGHDGCGLGAGIGKVYDSGVTVNHYGYLREVDVMIEKESRFQTELYHEGVVGLPDNRLVEAAKNPPKSKHDFYASFISPNDIVTEYDGAEHQEYIKKIWEKK